MQFAADDMRGDDIVLDQQGCDAKDRARRKARRVGYFGDRCVAGGDRTEDFEALEQNADRQRFVRAHRHRAMPFIGAGPRSGPSFPLAAPAWPRSPRAGRRAMADMPRKLGRRTKLAPIRRAPALTPNT